MEREWNLGENLPNFIPRKHYKTELRNCRKKGHKFHANGSLYKITDTLSTLTNSTLIILFSEMLKFSKIISSKSKSIVKENSEYLGIFLLLK
jgi:hypothetical protein